jgi:Zn-dependent protease
LVCLGDEPIGRNVTACARCDTELATTLLSCPACHTLVHSDTLKRLAADAESAEQAGDNRQALEKWRAALPLVPSDSQQYSTINNKIAELAGRTGAAQTKPQQPQHPLRRLWGAIVTGVIVVLSKLKLLLLGLTKLSTLASMLVFLGVYWSLWGWQFALGFVVCIYIHEMGHVSALRHYGIAATAPMFIPGLGAFVRLKQYPPDPRADARVGLAGPIWGLGAALACYAVFVATGAQIWGAIARTAGFLNLFNLIPIWQLDGGRGFRSLSRVERWVMLAVVLIAWWLTREGLLLLIALGAVYRAFQKDAPTERDPVTLATFAGLIVALTWLATISVRT